MSSQYIQRKKRLFMCNLKITYFRGKRKWACKNRMLHCATHFSANPVEKWAEVENSCGIERVHFFDRSFGGSYGKESACNAGDQGLIPGSGRSTEERNGHPLPIFLPGEFHGQRSLVGYSPRGSKSQTRLRDFHFHFSLKMEKDASRNRLKKHAYGSI